MKAYISVYLFLNTVLACYFYFHLGTALKITEIFFKKITEHSAICAKRRDHIINYSLQMKMVFFRSL